MCERRDARLSVRGGFSSDANDPWLSEVETDDKGRTSGDIFCGHPPHWFKLAPIELKRLLARGWFVKFDSVRYMDKLQDTQVGQDTRY